MNKIENAEIWEIAFQIAKKYNIDLIYRYKAKRNIDTYSLVKNEPTIERLKIEVDRDCHDVKFISNIRKYTRCICKFDDVKNIRINNLCEYNDDFEHFVNNLMTLLDFANQIRRE